MAKIQNKYLNLKDQYQDLLEDQMNLIENYLINHKYQPIYVNMLLIMLILMLLINFLNFLFHGK